METESLPRVTVITIVLAAVLGVGGVLLLSACCFWRTKSPPPSASSARRARRRGRKGGGGGGDGDMAKNNVNRIGENALWEKKTRTDSVQRLKNYELCLNKKNSNDLLQSMTSRIRGMKKNCAKCFFFSLL